MWKTRYQSLCCTCRRVLSSALPTSLMTQLRSQVSAVCALDTAGPSSSYGSVRRQAICLCPSHVKRLAFGPKRLLCVNPILSASLAEPDKLDSLYGIYRDCGNATSCPTQHCQTSFICREAAGAWINGRAFSPGGRLHGRSAAIPEDAHHRLSRLNRHWVSLCNMPDGTSNSHL